MNAIEAAQQETRITAFRALEAREKELVDALNVLNVNEMESTSGLFSQRQARNVENIHLELTDWDGKNSIGGLIVKPLTGVRIPANELAQALRAILGKKLHDVRDTMNDL